jgi:hypothetical protein
MRTKEGKEEKEKDYFISLDPKNYFLSITGVGVNESEY